MTVLTLTIKNPFAAELIIVYPIVDMFWSQFSLN